MITIEMPATLRQMIDARMDNIERALMTKGMGRGDRRQVLSAIEDQILEMLGQSTDEEPTREDLLRVLAKLDPPEAYLELSEFEVPSFPSAKTGERQMDADVARIAPVKKELNVLAVVAFVLTCFACLGSFFWWILSFYGLIPLAGITIAAGICGTIALHQVSGKSQSQGGLWMAVTACTCAPPIAFFSWVTLFYVEGM
jgi:hypothetical protein